MDVRNGNLIHLKYPKKKRLIEEDFLIDFELPSIEFRVILLYLTVQRAYLTLRVIPK